MKYFIALLFLLPCSAHSQNLNVQETALSSATVFTVAVASQPSVDVASITANGYMYGAYAIEVYNPSANSNTINCGFASNVSTTSTSNFYGREVAAGTGIVFHVSLPFIKVFCMSQSITGSTRATITQLK